MGVKCFNKYRKGKYNKLNIINVLICNYNIMF